MRYPAPFVPRALTFEVPERMDSTGRALTPLDEAHVVGLCERLRRDGIEAVSVCLLWSIVNPAHERAVEELLAQHLPGVPVTLSHRVSSSIREFRRASAAAIDASLKPLMGRYLGTLADGLAAEGFKGQLLVTTSQGGMLPAHVVAEMPILSIKLRPVHGARRGPLVRGEDRWRGGRHRCRHWRHDL